MLNTSLVRNVMLRSETVGPWMVARLKHPEQRASVVRYLETVSRAAEEERGSLAGATRAVALTKAFAEIPDLLPAMLQLPEEDQVKEEREVPLAVCKTVKCNSEVRR